MVGYNRPRCLSAAAAHAGSRTISTWGRSVGTWGRSIRAGGRIGDHSTRTCPAIGQHRASSDTHRTLDAARHLAHNTGNRDASRHPGVASTYALCS